MHRVIKTALVFLCIALPLAAQIQPDWYNAASRKMHYPDETCFTGFVAGMQQAGETQEEAVERLRNAARVELVASIRTSVRQSIHNRAVSDLRQSGTAFDEQVQETHVSDVQITSGIRDIPGLKTDIYSNPKNGEIAAFAYVKRQALVSHLTRRIAIETGKAEGLLPLIEQHIADGQKHQARTLAQTALQNVVQIEETQNLLAAVDETADDETLQLAQTRKLRQTLVAIVTKLQNAVTVYLHCEAVLFGTAYTALAGTIRGQLSEAGVTFVNEPEQADWAVYVTATAREYTKSVFGNYCNYAAVVEADVHIDTPARNKRIYSNHLTSDICSHTVSFTEAGREAYKEITPRLCAIIREQTAL